MTDEKTESLTKWKKQKKRERDNGSVLKDERRRGRMEETDWRRKKGKGVPTTKQVNDLKWKKRKNLSETRKRKAVEVTKYKKKKPEQTLQK